MPLAPVLWSAGLTHRGKEEGSGLHPHSMLVPRPEKKEKTNKQTSESHTAKGSTTRPKASCSLKEDTEEEFLGESHEQMPILSSGYYLVIIGLKLPIKHIYRCARRGRWSPWEGTVTSRAMRTFRGAEDLVHHFGKPIALDTSLVPTALCVIFYSRLKTIRVISLLLLPRQFHTSGDHGLGFSSRRPVSPLLSPGSLRPAPHTNLSIIPDSISSEPLTQSVRLVDLGP